MKPRTIMLVTTIFAVLWLIVCMALVQGQAPSRSVVSSSLNVAYPITSSPH